MLSLVPLLVAAATVGTLHMSAPDHWCTLIALGRISKWNRSRLLGISAMTAAGHVGLSILLGFLVVGLGLLFSEQIAFYVAAGTGLAMVVGGLAYGLRQLTTASEMDYEEKTKKKLSRGEGPLGKRFRYFAVLGAALSPDLSILPIFLLAVPLGLGLAFDTALVFGLASTVALLSFVMLGAAGLAKAFEAIPPKYNDALIGFVVAAVGMYVLVVG
jgi:nickel/cobalt transporter (NicO) family protein